MPAVAGKMTKHLHNWTRYVGYRFEKFTAGEEHGGFYFMEVLSPTCVVHSGKYVRGFIIWDPTSWDPGKKNAASTSGTMQTRVSGGWRHALTGFFDLPAPKFLYPVLNKGVPFVKAFYLAQRHENNANTEGGSTKRSFGDTRVVRMPAGRTVDDVEKEYLLAGVKHYLQ